MEAIAELDSMIKNLKHQTSRVTGNGLRAIAVRRWVSSMYAWRAFHAPGNWIVTRPAAMNPPNGERVAVGARRLFSSCSFERADLTDDLST